jgi:hypothetical protein
MDSRPHFELLIELGQPWKALHQLTVTEIKRETPIRQEVDSGDIDTMRIVALLLTT